MHSYLESPHPPDGDPTRSNFPQASTQQALGYHSLKPVSVLERASVSLSHLRLLDPPFHRDLATSGEIGQSCQSIKVNGTCVCLLRRVYAVPPSFFLSSLTILLFSYFRVDRGYVLSCFLPSDIK